MTTERQAWRMVMRDWDVGPATAVAAAQRFIQAFPDRYQAWLAASHHLVELGRYVEAARALRRAERLAPDRERPRVWEQWGLMYRAKHDARSAERWFRKALMAGAHSRRHVFLGATLARQGRLTEALVQHRAAIALNSSDGDIDEAHLNAALVLRALGKYDEAHEHLVEALRMDPKYSDALIALRDIKGVLRGRNPQANQRLQPTARAGKVSAPRLNRGR